MGKEFIERNQEEYDGMAIYTKIRNYAIRYTFANRPIKNINNETKNYILADFIEYCAKVISHKFLISIELLKEKEINKKISTKLLLTVLLDLCSQYIFVNKKYNTAVYDNHLTLILDFINFIAKINNYDRTFKEIDIYTRFQEKKHRQEMEELKVFLMKVNHYTRKLQNGNNINIIFNRLAKRYGLNNISKNITNDTKPLLERKHLNYWKQEQFNNDFYALAYAYYKSPYYSPDAQIKGNIKVAIDKMKVKKK